MKDMSSSKRKMLSSSSQSMAKRQRKNERQKAQRAQKAQWEQSLFPVNVQSDVAMDENLHLSLAACTSMLHNTDSSTFTADDTDEDDRIEGLLSDIPIEITRGNMMQEKLKKQPALPTQPYQVPVVQPCKFCGAKRLQYESPSFCCSQGQVSLYPIEMPLYLRELYSGVHQDSGHFINYIKPYNEIFGFTSMGVHLDAKYAKRTKGIYTFRAQGKIHHFISPLHPRPHDNPNPMQLYFYDTDNEVSNRKRIREQLQPHIIAELIKLLHENNPYSKFFRGLHDVPHLDEYQIVLRGDPLITDYTALPPKVSQVAAMWIEDENAPANAPCDIKIYQHDGGAQTINHYYGCYDPLQYPLLFPCGEPGWHRGIKRSKSKQKRTFSSGQGKVLPLHFETADALITSEKNLEAGDDTRGATVSAREYYAYRLQIREGKDSILLHSGRLFQQFIVDMYFKVETSRLDFFRLNQKEIRADLYKRIVDSVLNGESDPSKVGKRIVLPASFLGGPRDLRKRYLDAMALVEKFGKPDIFLTMTCNPNWPEISNWKRLHEEANNRPDLLCRVFRSKCIQLEKEVVKKELFGPVVAYAFVIEFQKRGLPRIHLLVILKAPFKITSMTRIDEIISAEIPDASKDPHLYRMVIKHMMHGPCGELNPKNVCMVNGKCKNHYPKQFCEETSLTSDGYPLYRRCDNGVKATVRGKILDNRWVIPYNPYLLALFDCHINVEVCSTVKSVKYLYKYIYKGHDKIMYHIANAPDNEIIDEIQQFQSARWISPPEAVWRILRFPLYQIRPAVISLHLHLEGCHLVPLRDDTNLHDIVDNHFHSRTMLTQFFWMNTFNPTAKALNLLYKEFPEHFVWNAQARAWSQRKSKDVIGRIITANPIEGERFYLRLLLGYIHAPHSYEHLRTIDGVIYESFREAAMAHGLLEDDHSNEKCMSEASMFQMPISLRQLFCTILIYCSPVNPKELFFKFEDEMMEDYMSIQHLPKHEARQSLLQALNSQLQSIGRSLSDYQLSALLTAPRADNELSKEIEDELSFIVSETDLASITLLNDEQKIAYDMIIESVFGPHKKSFFIDGPGGTGKTFLYKALLANVRSQQKIALATATSGVAAAILPNGRTAHSRFKIPINFSESSSCNVSKRSGLANLLKDTALIIWDEASMSRKESIEALDSLLRDICENDIILGGKVVVFGGDFRQTLPVVPKGTRQDTVKASLVRSYIWDSLMKLRLTQNMRARTDPIFSAYILKVGEGTEPEDNHGNIRLPMQMVIDPRLTSGLDQLIEFVFPNIIARIIDPSSLTSAAILTPKNQGVDDINLLLISKFHGKEHIYFSYDETKDPSLQGLYIDFLNSITPPGLPPHRLLLKKDCPVLLLRNINPSQGLCNGTRLICKEFSPHVISAEIAIGEKKGSNVFIPRIPLEPNDSSTYPVEFRRRQFPIRLCFAMTVNKAQGQTLTRVGIYLPDPVFSHGQLYVALSRVTTASNMRIYIKHNENDVVNYMCTKNIVYREVLEETNSV